MTRQGLAAAALMLTASAFAQTSSDYTQGVAGVSATQAQVRFTPNGFTAGYVIVHYLVDNGGQQNVNMTWNAGTVRWEQTVSGLATGSVLTYSFSYQKNGVQYDTPWFAYTHGGTANPTPTPTPACGEITPPAAGVTASTHDGNVPGNAVDDSWLTRWSANGDGQWLRLDLGTIRSVGDVRIAFYNGNVRQSRFDLQTSTDGVSWTNALSSALSSGTTTAEQTFDFSDRSARYVRYLGHGNTVNLWNSLYEVGVFGACGGTAPTPTPTPAIGPTPTPSPTAPVTVTPTPTPTSGGCYEEVTPGAAGVTASTHDGNVPGNAVDNSGATRWSANGDGQWLKLDLGLARTVGHMRIAFYNGNVRQSRFDLQTSTDDVSWTNVVTGGLSSGSTTAEQTFDFTDRSARWVRYLGHGNTVNAWNSLYEASVFAACGGVSTPTPTPTPAVRVTPTPTSAPGGCATCTTKRLKIINGCTQPIWIQYHTGSGGGALAAPNRFQLAAPGSFIEYDIPDKGLAGVRFWPGMGCDSTGQNCKIGASGGPASMGFTCPAGIGCAPPVDSKFEGTFGCLPGVDAASCQPNPSGSGVLGRNDWWNTSMVDGYTLPVQVRVIGNCPVGPQSDGPGGPVGGIVDCSSLRFADCPRSENLSTDGQFPSLSSVDLLLKYPNADGTPSSVTAGCFSPSAKLTSAQWQSLPKPPFTGTTYSPADVQAVWYACPSPPITPQQCMAGPASRTTYTNRIHSHCNNTYAYAYDDVAGLLSCPAATNLRYEVTFYCPQ